MPLSVVARITEKREPATLTRIDGKRAVRVSARADTAMVTPIQARRDIHEQVIPDLLAKYPGLAVETEEGARDESDLLGTLGILVPIVLIAINALIVFVPFVVSMLGGLVAATLGILFVLPALVMIAEGRRE